MAESPKDQDEAKLAKLAKRLLVTPPKPRPPAPGKRSDDKRNEKSGPKRGNR